MRGSIARVLRKSMKTNPGIDADEKFKGRNTGLYYRLPHKNKSVLIIANHPGSVRTRYQMIKELYMNGKINRAVLPNC